MPRQETILSVFVASPSDVDEERNRLEDVVRELNITWARELNVRLELVRWETHAFPSFGEDAQAVVNAQIPNDYDLFVGLMWYRFGTATGRAGSGTVEEFQRAKERFDNDPSALQLMFYFKDAPVPLAPHKIDSEQLARVAEFRSSLGEEGSLYWSILSVDEFERMVRLHLTRFVQSWRSRHVVSDERKLPEREPTASALHEASLGSSSDQMEELGLLDLMEEFEDEFAMVVEITERIAAATVEIGEKMEIHATEVKRFNTGPEAKNPKAAKRLIAKAAADMDQFVHRMEAELPLFGRHLNAGMNALTQSAAMGIEFKIEGDNLEQVGGNLRAVETFRSTLTTVESQIGGFQAAVASLPRMTTALNRARRATVEVLQKLMDEFRSAQSMAREAEESFARILDDK